MRKNSCIWKQAAAGIMVCAMAFGTAACGQESAQKETDADSQAAENVQEEGGEDSTGEDSFSYPMEEITFTINYGSDPYDMSQFEWVGEDYYHLKLQKATGVTLEDVGALPNAYDPSEEFLLLLASGEYPDFFYCNWASFPGGPDAAIGDGYIISLNEYAEYMPNFMKYLDENPEIKKMVSTDDGKLYSFPFVRDEAALVETGAMIRQDLLDELGLEVPETMEEWYEVLTAFKEAGIKTPLTFESRWLFLEYATACLSSAYGTAYPFYLDGDTVKFGPLEDGYREFVTEMNRWYAEGLIDPDMPSVDKSTVAAKMASGEAAVTINQLSKVPGILSANEGTDFALAGVPTAVKESGDTPEFSHYRNAYDGSYSVSISTQCRDIEKACRYMDYLFSEEGSMLTNYGTEGVSYTVENGKVQFTDAVMNNENEDASGARKRYANYYNWPNIEKDPYIQLDAIDQEIQKTWMANMDAHAYPTVTHTQEESSVISDKYSTIDDYCREMILKFIIGTEDLADWDSFVDQVKAYGIDEVLECKQAAYDRYMAR